MSFTGKTALAWKVRFIQAFNAMEKELQKQQHNKNFETDAKGSQISPLLSRPPCTDEQLDALRSLVYLMSQFDDTSEEEAETVLCHALRIEDLSQLAVSDFNYAFDHCWRYIHRFYPSQRGPSDPADMNVARRLISLAAYQSGAPRQSIADYVCHMCNIRSLDDGARCSAKVILAIWGVLVRVADRSGSCFWTTRRQN